MKIKILKHFSGLIPVPDDHLLERSDNERLMICGG